MRRSFSQSLVLGATCLTFVSLAQAAPAGPGNNRIDQAMEQFGQALQHQTGNHNLRESGAFDFISLATSMGLVPVDNISESFPADGGGQNGAFARVNESDRSLGLEFSPSFIKRASRVFCLKEAVERVEKKDIYSDEHYTVYEVKEGQEDQCLEVASTSQNLAHDQFVDYHINFAAEESEVNYYTTPSFTAELKVEAGKVSTNLEFGGSFDQKIYLWHNKKKAGEHLINEHLINLEVLKPVVVLNQGHLAKDRILEVFKDVEWLAYGVPSIWMDVDQARKHLGAMEPLYNAFAQRLLNEIEKYQETTKVQEEEAKKAGLYPSEDLASENKKCKEARANNSDDYDRNADLRAHCRAISDQVWEVTRKRRANPIYDTYEQEKEQAFPVIDAILDVLVSHAEENPEIINFLINIQSEIN